MSLSRAPNGGKPRSENLGPISLSCDRISTFSRCPMIDAFEACHAQPCGDIGIGHWVDLLPGRDQALERGHGIRPLLTHEPGDVLDVEKPLPGVPSKDFAPQPKLDG